MNLDFGSVLSFEYSENKFQAVRIKAHCGSVRAYTSAILSVYNPISSGHK